MAKLILLRHLQSQWNLENRFAGWTDGPLSGQGKEKAKEIAEKVFQSKIDVAYSSPLFRNLDTIDRILEGGNSYPFFVHLDGGKMEKWGNRQNSDKNEIKVFVSEKLNERYYGKLQGLNKEETMKKFGQEKVRLWRRGYNTAPPGGESLKDVFKRAVPFYRKYIENDLRQGKNVLIVASHNSLRALVKYIENISDIGIANLEIPYAGIIEYEFDENLKLKSRKMF